MAILACPAPAEEPDKLTLFDGQEVVFVGGQWFVRYSDGVEPVVSDSLIDIAIRAALVEMTGGGA